MTPDEIRPTEIIIDREGDYVHIFLERGNGPRERVGSGLLMDGCKLHLRLMEPLRMQDFYECPEPKQYPQQAPIPKDALPMGLGADLGRAIGSTLAGAAAGASSWSDIFESQEAEIIAKQMFPQSPYQMWNALGVDNYTKVSIDMLKGYAMREDKGLNHSSFEAGFNRALRDPGKSRMAEFNRAVNTINNIRQQQANEAARARLSLAETGGRAIGAKELADKCRAELRGAGIGKIEPCKVWYDEANGCFKTDAGEPMKLMAQEDIRAATQAPSEGPFFPHDVPVPNDVPPGTDDPMQAMRDIVKRYSLPD